MKWHLIMINQTDRKEKLRAWDKKRFKRNEFSLRYIEFDVPTAKDKSNWHKAIKVHSTKEGVQYVMKRQVMRPQ